jgi:ATP-dependent DNA ligase
LQIPLRTLGEYGQYPALGREQRLTDTFSEPEPYIGYMMFEFCLPTKSNTVPAGPEWLHEIKYDGYRLRVERDGDRVRLITRGGYNWTRRYPLKSKLR